MHKSRSIRLIICVAAGLALPLALPSAAQAASGALDATFGIGGKVTTDFAGDSDEARGVVLQPDGKIVAAGAANTEGSRDRGSGGDFALARYNPNGALDATFGTGGKVTTDFNGDDDAAFGVVLQPDGKIVAAGAAKTSYRGQDFALARYNPNGTLDATFGTGGKVTTDFNGDDDAAFGVVLQPDGKIVAAGAAKTSYRGQDFALARYNPNGTLDATFGTGGKVTTDFNGDDAAFGVVLQPDGKIVAAGAANTEGSRDRGSGGDFALARYLG